MPLAVGGLAGSADQPIQPIDRGLGAAAQQVMPFLQSRQRRFGLRGNADRSAALRLNSAQSPLQAADRNDETIVGHGR